MTPSDLLLLRPEDICDFDVTWDPDAKLWRGQHNDSDRKIQAPNLRALEIRAMSIRIAHEWRKVSN
jgi:hypothetical protein